MDALVSAKATSDWPYHEDILALRTHVLHRLILSGIVTGILWYGYLALSQS